MSVDMRTRVDGRQEAVDPVEFFDEQLPRYFGEAADLLSAAIEWLAPDPLSVVVGTRAWSLVAGGGGVEVSAGRSDGGTTVVLSQEQISDLVNDQVTPMGWFSSGRLDLQGSLATFQNWWLLLRGALDGVAPYLPGEIDFRDTDGGPIDLQQSFSPQDPPEAMSHFLREAGFLHVKGLFDEDEMARVSADMDEAAPRYSPGDGNSWWATTEDGNQRLVRMQRFDQESRAVADLLVDERFTRVAALTGDGHQSGHPGSNRIEALFKPIGVVKGISDVPWHKDCSLGRHSYECCALTVGISVTGAGSTSG